jgi:putative hemolysin
MDSLSDPGTHIWLQIIILLLIIFISALFEAGETALNECSRNKVKALAASGDARAEKLLRILDSPQKFLDGTQTIVVFGTVFMSAFAAYYFAPEISASIGDASGPRYVITVLAIVLLLALAIIVLGILYPRRIAILHAEGMALALVDFLATLLIVVRPFVALNNGIVNILLRLTHQTVTLDDDEFSEDDVMDMLEVGQESGALKEEGKKMINSIFEFDDKLAYEVMTPRTDAFMIDVNDPPEEYLDELMELRYSRIPVYENDTDNIIGILNIKDYFAKAKTEGFENVDIRSILRKPLFVPETKNIDSLFMQLQSTKNQLAILIDEFGGFSGIVSMEDIIEEVMGDIEDEYDRQELEIEQVSDDTYLVDGSADLDDINEAIGLSLDSENAETIGGLALDILGEIPEDGENLDTSIELDSCTIVVKKVAERRIERVLIKLKQPEETGEHAEPKTEGK